MKIGLFTDTYLPDVNGVVSSVVLLRKKLIEHGHEVWIITNRKGFAKIDIDYKEKIIRLPGLELKQLYGYKASQPLHLLLIDELRDLNFDIIHAQQEFGVGMFASIVSKTLRIPMVRTYHTAYEDYTSYFLPIYNKLIDDVAKKAIEQFSLMIGEDCLRLIAPSKKTKEMLLRYGISTPIEVIPTGLELERFNPKNFSKKERENLRKKLNVNNNEQLFLYVGRIGHEKSIDIIIKGFKKVAESKQSAKLIIVGDGTAFNDLVELKESLKLDEQVKFVGKIKNTEIAKYYNAADCFVCASKTETQGMTFIEAMAAGLPLICRDDDVLYDVLIDKINGYYFTDEDDFALKAISFINLDDKKKQDLSKNALNKANEYDADLFADKIANLYEDVIVEYDSHYIISKIQLKNDNVILTLSNESIVEKVTVSTDTYLELGLRKNDKLTKPIYDRLIKEEKETVAYQACIKRLANRDYSEREMRDYLYVNHEISKDIIDKIINRLKDKSFIDDEKYVFNKINSYEKLLYSKRMMIRKLKEAGIEEFLINKYLHDDGDKELVKAKKRAEKFNSTIKGKSLNARKLTIMQKLSNDGFSIDVSKQAINYLDFSNASLEESDILKKEAYKAKLKYQRKYSGRDLRNHVYNSLVNKGFEYEKIYALIDEMEWENE